MATEGRTAPAGSAQGAVVARWWWHSLSGRLRLLMLPIVLGWCGTLVYGAMEEMMIAPIEVIEEWGCYDTEIRLTCGNLESKIAILEARFTPRCMEERSENCVYMDEHSVAHPFASQKVDKLVLEETEAGRRFLATLRRNHERELDAAGVDGPGTQELTAGEAVHRRQGATMVAARSLAKDKRSSLRATLEHLIVRYLRRLTSDDDGDGDDGDEPGGYEVAARYRRQSLPATGSSGVVGISAEPASTSSSTSPGFSNSMEITLLTNDTDTNLTESWEDGGSREKEEEEERWNVPPDSSLTAGAMEPQASDAAAGYGSSGPLVAGLLVGTREGPGDVMSVSEGERGTGDGGDGGDSAAANGDSVFRDNGDEVEYNLPIGGSVPTVYEADGQQMGELRKQRKQQKPKQQRGECDSVRKRVSQLDRFELELSMRNGSFREYNIRNALNYRCSGKNHCSFIFSQDHPFAVVWKEGTVRIKYICMDDFRISKYCGEHLIVGNEVHWEPLDGDSDEDSTDDDEETAGSTGSSWRQRTPPTDGIANGSANDVPDEQPSGRDPNEGGEDLRDESLVTLQERHYAAAGSPYRRLVRAGAVGEPRAEALQAATVHSFHNLKILKPVDDEEEAALERHQQQKHSQQQSQQQSARQHQQQPHNETDMDRNQQQQEAEAATRNRNRQRQKVFSQDFRVLKILPSNLDVVEDIKQIGNEYYFKKDVEVVIDDRENEIVDSESGSKTADNGQPVAGTTNTTGDGDMTETLDIVVLPAPTKDIEIYDNDLVPDGEAGSARPDDDDGDDISVIGLISPTRTAASTSPMTTASGGLEGSSSTPMPPTVETTLGHWDVDRLDLPEPAEEDNRSSLAVDTPNTPPPFSFNNRTFQTMQETVRKEFDESQGPYPPVGNYDEEEDFDDEDDDGDEDERGGDARTSGPYGRLDKSHKKHMSVQRTLLKHPLRQGFLMTPSYPKYYIGDSTCRWTLYAGVHQRIKLTVLDLALRYDDECRDYLQVVDLNTNQTLFHSCTESSRPIEIVSIQERLEVSVRTTTKVIYPKRGVLVHYTALGCELPSPTPGHMRLVRRTEHRVKYVCDPLHVFPDTGESVRELICTAKHTWNRPLPACIEKRATEGSGLVSHYEQKRRYGDTDNMSDKQADTVYDILIPSLIIAGLFVVNGIVFAVIMRYRNKRKQRLDLETRE
ncbi:uncharacterized protein LOC118513670 isoform X2 [Anopheles stephensi]|uniref:uncharacterized protein LOC118513670 isoform X2 n=1 Tax=Anopheles stephensi TaxID=30069 RepID=UPI001658748F|nr:uncharacterized protein LOC118513670 isoform X2 [Anopheles stephensi]